jgi:pyridoxamine 5'-phosphate oxidase family protein
MGSAFTPEEITYLQSQRLGRLATIDEQGDLHVVPVSFRYNSEHDTIDIGGHNVAGTKKYRDATHYGRAAFVVDDVLPPWRPRMVEIRGTVQGLSSGGQDIVKDFAPEILRITPTYIVSLGLVDQGNEPRPAWSARIRGRRVEK